MVAPSAVRRRPALALRAAEVVITRGADGVPVVVVLRLVKAPPRRAMSCPCRMRGPRRALPSLLPHRRRPTRGPRRAMPPCRPACALARRGPRRAPPCPARPSAAQRGPNRRSTVVIHFPPMEAGREKGSKGIEGD